MTTQWIWFDMDGTIADLYNTENWLADIRNLNARPYLNAKPLYDLVDLFFTLADLRSRGYKLGIISWSSRTSNSTFDMAVEKAKNEWLYNNLLDCLFDKVIVTAYGINKADTCRPYGSGILVDDEITNLEKWDLGGTINANNNILEILKNLEKCA